MKPNTSFAGVIFGDRLPLPKVAMRVVEMKRFNFDRTFIVSNHPEIFSFLIRGNTEVVASCEEVLARLEGFSGTVVVVSDKSTCRRLDALPLTDGFSEQYEDYKFYIGGSNDHDVSTDDAVDTMNAVVDENRHNASRLPGVMYERFNSEHPPVLTVCLITHNRTAVACHCLDALCKRLRYSGRVHWVICDDMSETGHVEALEKVLLSNGVSDYAKRLTNVNRHGLGASMNNGLSEAFSLSDVVLTVEDDFLLIRDFDITDMVRALCDNDVAGIRLAHLSTDDGGKIKYTTMIERSPVPGFIKVVGGNIRNPRHTYVFNNQVMLRHRRVYDRIGVYMENVGPEDSEETTCARYVDETNRGRSDKCMTLYPKSLMTDTFNNGLFVHIGRSTSNHRHPIPYAYEKLNSEELDRDMRSRAIMEQGSGGGVSGRKAYIFSNCSKSSIQEYRKNLIENVPKDAELFILNRGDMWWKLDPETRRRYDSKTFILRNCSTHGFETYFGLQDLVGKSSDVKRVVLFKPVAGTATVSTGLADGSIENRSIAIPWMEEYRRATGGKDATTGYSAWNLVQQLYGFSPRDIVLVNFYGNADNSTYKDSSHSWGYEDKWLKDKNRIFL